MKSTATIALLALIAQIASAFEPTEDGMYAVFDTSMGEFTVKLAFDGVPLTTANFVGLAEGKIPYFSNETGEALSAKPYYDGMIFHRVVKNFVIQAGDPDPDDDQANGPGYRIPDEMHPNLSHEIPYVISMANNYCFPCEENSGQRWVTSPSEEEFNERALEFLNVGENTGGSQFFITVEPSANSAGPGYLDGHFTVFGVVEDGSEVVEAISGVGVDQSYQPLEDVVIHSVKILRRGEAAENWNIEDYELPVIQAANKDVSLAQTDDGPAFRFPAAAGEKLLLQESEDLSDWSQDFLNIGEASDVEVDLAGREKLFLELFSVSDPTAYEERIPNATFEADIFNHPFGARQTVTWSFKFNSNSDDTENPERFGIVSVPNLPDARILAYQYHRLPNGARLRIVTQSQQVMTFYLRFIEGNLGGYVAWIDDYFHGTESSQPPYFVPQRFPVTGFFELSTP
ncbi:peptidylprolyl isomerase [Pelagicoccus enzymogenes]|uniref:peptidylprolyl isomerase n=1 Tax=Pelagicoccus enzymogenes TaxID=2773457 RepID=UPI00280C6313|nr:peptidylprolyl isomerase [Pelagicoccus enzymogenes]MDQ8199107.1 peptidylprolyl isomerase [Pelagicoccus enzymogenes]